MAYTNKDKIMAKKINWHYHRRGWKSCTKAQEFLAKNGNAIAEEQNATKDRIEGKEVLKVLKGKTKLLVAKGKKRLEIDLKTSPSNDDLVAAMTGPTGNLRAPTLVVGKTVVVGFQQELYEDVL